MAFKEWESYVFDAIDAIRQDFESDMWSFSTREIQERVQEDKGVDMSYKAIYNLVRKIKIERGGREVPVFEVKKTAGKTKYIGYVDVWDEFYSVCKSPHAQRYMTMRLIES